MVNISFVIYSTYQIDSLIYGKWSQKKKDRRYWETGRFRWKENTYTQMLQPKKKVVDNFYVKWCRTFGKQTIIIIYSSHLIRQIKPTINFLPLSGYRINNLFDVTNSFWKTSFFQLFGVTNRNIGNTLY